MCVLLYTVLKSQCKVSSHITKIGIITELTVLHIVPEIPFTCTECGSIDLPIFVMFSKSYVALRHLLYIVPPEHNYSTYISLSQLAKLLHTSDLNYTNFT